MEGEDPLAVGAEGGVTVDLVAILVVLFLVLGIIYFARHL